MTNEMLSREDWLRAGVQLFSEKGIEGLSLKEVSRKCAAKPSDFYDFFQNEDEFLQYVLLFWKKEKTTYVIERLNREAVEKRLEKLVDLVFSDRTLGDFLFYLRHLSRRDERAARLLHEIEEQRINSTRYIFGGLGFGMKEINLKVEILYSFYLGWYERYKFEPFTPELRQRTLEQLHHLLNLED